MGLFVKYINYVSEPNINLILHCFLPTWPVGKYLAPMAKRKLTPPTGQIYIALYIENSKALIFNTFFIVKRR